MPTYDALSFGTFNLLNLNLPGLPMYSSDGWDEQTYQKKVAWSAAMIERIAPADIWGFQELWHEQALADVFETAGLVDDYRLLVPPGHSGGSIVCGGAVRTDLVTGEPEWIEDFPDKIMLQSGGDDAQTSDIAVQLRTFSRPVLHFRIRPRTDEEDISVYVAHLKSKRPAAIYYEDWYENDRDYYGKHRDAIGAALSTIRRTAEAAALRMILTEEMKGTDNPVVVLGDLNDAQLSNTLNIITEQPNYLTGLSRGGSDVDLYSVASLQEYRSLRDVYYTHVYQNIRQSLDHILVSQEFYDNSYRRIWAFEAMDAYNDHLNLDDHKEHGTSDHGIVRARFEYDPA